MRAIAAGSTWRWCGSRTGCATGARPDWRSARGGWWRPCGRPRHAFPAPLILAVCPPRRPRSAFGSRSEYCAERLADLAGVYRSGAGATCRRSYPVAEVHDPHGDELGHLPYTPVFFVALATAIARKIHAIVDAAVQGDRPRLRRHAVGGHLRRRRPAGRGAGRAAPGVAGVHGGAPARGHAAGAGQQEQRRGRGGDVPRPPGNAACGWRISPRGASNWEAKSANLASLAEELELGLDSFILVDDNPKECTEAQAGCPEVLALPLPARAEEIPEFLQARVGLRPRARDGRGPARPELYAQQRRAGARRSARRPAWRSFWRRLQLEVGIAPMEPAQLARVAQLTQRTNQMNASADAAHRGGDSGVAGCRRASASRWR